MNTVWPLSARMLITGGFQFLLIREIESEWRHGNVSPFDGPAIRALFRRLHRLHDEPKMVPPIGSSPGTT